MWVGLSYQALGDLARAQEHYQKARGLTSATSPSIRSSASHANLQGLLFSGLIYERLGDHIRARQTWQRGVELLKPDREAYPYNLKRRVFLACFHGVLGEKAAFFAELERALSTNVNLWECYLLAVVLARTGETERASELLLRIARQGRIRPDIDWLFETIVSLPAPRSDTFNELVETQTRRLREMY